MLRNDTITHVAIAIPGVILYLPKPNRHHHIFEMAEKLGLDINVPDQVQGFMTNTDRFVNRFQARDIAVQGMGVKPTHWSELFSEDVW